MRNGNEHTLDFYTSPQPTDYVKKERKKKAADGGSASETVLKNADSYDPPVYEKPARSFYYSPSPYRWDDD